MTAPAMGSFLPGELGRTHSTAALTKIAGLPVDGLGRRLARLDLALATIVFFRLLSSVSEYPTSWGTLNNVFEFLKVVFNHIKIRLLD